METIIGLGQAGCAIADRFAQYPQYEVYKMDVGLKGPPHLRLKEAPSPEEQEVSWKLETLFQGRQRRCAICGCRLRGGFWCVIKNFRTNQRLLTAHLIYLFRCELLGETARLQQRVTFNVFQEYARSGVLQRVILVDNTALKRSLETSQLLVFMTS